MIDREKVIKDWESILSCDPLDVPWDLIDDTLVLLKEQEEQKRKWLQAIADTQLAVSPKGYETEEGLAKMTGVWNGLQMAWDILTKDT